MLGYVRRVIHAQLYDSNGSKVGDQFDTYRNGSYFSRPVTSGQVYYIKVTASGASVTSFKIALNVSNIAP
jgi:hypothetical protein